MPCVRRAWRSSRAGVIQPLSGPAGLGDHGKPRGVTVTVPLLTGREIRALKRPEAFLRVILRQTIIGGHGNRCQLHPKLASLCRFRQHSIVTAPADTDPSPRMRNLTLRDSGSTSLLPAPVVALSCRGFSTLIIAFSL